MPKQTINYKDTIIYKIVCKDLNVKDLYVGHTTNFTKRKYQHKHDCYNPKSKIYNNRVYDFIRKNGGFDNWDMIEVEKHPCKDRNEATKRERYWYEELKGTLNAFVPSRTKKEYYQEKKEEILLKKKEYDKEHKEEIAHYQKEYGETHKEQISQRRKEKVECPCGSLLRKIDLARHKKSQKHQEWEKTNE